MTPAERSAAAKAEVDAWRAQSPHLIDVLSWHERLCGTCEMVRKCAEYREIVEEYGAGEFGITAFFPVPDETLRLRGGLPWRA